MKEHILSLFSIVRQPGPSLRVEGLRRGLACLFAVCVMVPLAARIVILDTPEHAAPFAKAAGAEVAAAFPTELKAGDVLVLTGDSPLSPTDEEAVEAFVQRGGGVLVTHTGDNPQRLWERWHNSPIERVLPAVFTPKGVGIENYYGRTRLVEAAAHPITAGCDFTTRPLAPAHTPVVLPTSPTLSRHLLWPVLPDNILKPMISREWTPLVWGDDAERRCLLAVGRFGAGRTAFLGVDLAALAGWTSYPRFCANLMTWLAEGKPAPALPQLLALRVDAAACASLHRMGFDVRTAPPADWKALEAVIVGDLLPDTEAKPEADYFNAGGRLIALSPQAAAAFTRRRHLDEPLLSQVWQVTVTPGKAFAQRRPPRLPFGNTRWQAVGTSPNGRHDWNFFTDATGWLRLPAGGGAGYALAVNPSHKLKLDGAEIKPVTPPVAWKDTLDGQLWLPLDSLAPGMHTLQSAGVPRTGETIRLVKLADAPVEPAVVATAGGWTYKAAGSIPVPRNVPQLINDGWTTQPPAGAPSTRPLPTLVPLPAPPAIALPKTWKFTQVGDDITDVDLQGRWFVPEFNDATWDDRAIGELTREVGGKRVRWDQHDGAVWYRARVTIPADAPQSGGFMRFNAGSNHVAVWLDGVKMADGPHQVLIPLTRCKAGDVLIAARVWARPNGTMVPWSLTGLLSVTVEAGTVRCRLDRENAGEAEGWWAQAPQATDAPQTLDLPGAPQKEPITWLWLTLDAKPNAADLRLAAIGPETLKAWLNGAPLSTAENQSALTIPGAKLKPGSNTLVVRRVNTPVWESHPGLQLAAAPVPPPATWARCTVTLEQSATGICLDDVTAPGLLYVDETLVGALVDGNQLLPAELAPGQHRIVCYLPQGGKAPPVKVLAQAALPALVASWHRFPANEAYRYRTTATTPTTMSALTVPHVPGSDQLCEFTRRDTDWFAGTFTVPRGQADRPLLLHFTSALAVATEPGLVKELLFNGACLTPYGNKWDEPGTLTHKTTTFYLGKPREGINIIAFRPDFSGYKGLDTPVPSNAPWVIPMPVLTTNEDWSEAEWHPNFGKPTNNNLIVDMIPSGDYDRCWRTTQRRYQPAALHWPEWTVAGYDLESRPDGPYFEATCRNLNPIVRPPVTWEDWGGEQNDMEGGALAGNGTYENVHVDNTQLLCDKLLHPGEQQAFIRDITATPAKRQFALPISVKAPFTGQLSVRIQSWEGALLTAECKPVVVQKAGIIAVTVDLSAIPNYWGTELKDEYLVRAAILSADGSRVLDYVEKLVDTTPPVSVHLATDDPSERQLPDAIPGVPQYRKAWAAWQPANEALPAYVYFPGEMAHLHAAVTNHTEKTRTVTLELALAAQLAGKSSVLSTQTLTLAPYEQRWITVARPLKDEFEAYALTATLSEKGVDTVRKRLPFCVIKPFKNLRDPESVSRKNGFGLHGPGAGFINLGAFDAPLFDQATIYGATSPELDWWKLDNLIEAPGNGGGFWVPDIRRNFYWGPFDRGAASGGSALDNSSFLPNGERYWEWQGRELRASLRTRQGDVPTGAALADWWVQFTMHPVPRNVLMFARWAEVVKRYTAKGRTVSELRDELQRKFPVEWEAFFVTDAATRNTELIGTVQAPGSAMWSQMDWAGPMMAMRNGYEWAKIAGRWFNAGEPDNCLRRVYIGERFRAYATAAARAMAPDFSLTTFHGQEPGTNNQAYSWPHAQGGVGIWPAENYSRALHDWIWMQVADADGAVQPVTNLPSWRNEGTLSLFGGVMGYSTGTLAEWQLFGRAFTLMNVIGPEQPLGAGFVVSQPRTEKGPPIPGRYDASANMGNINSSTMNDPQRNLWETLRNYGAAISTFVSPPNIGKAPNPALVYAVPCDADYRELEKVRARKGLVALYSTGGNAEKETILSTYFGVKFAPDAPKDAPLAATPKALAITGLPVGWSSTVPAGYTGPNYIHVKDAGSDLFTLPGDRVGVKIVDDGKHRAAFSSLYGGSDWGADHDLARALAETVNWAAGNPIRFPAGVTGYGFQTAKWTFLVVEELTAQGGPREVLVKLPPDHYRAVNLLDNTPVPAKWLPSGYLRLTPALRPLEAQLIAIQATP